MKAVLAPPGRAKSTPTNVGLRCWNSHSLHGTKRKKVGQKPHSRVLTPVTTNVQSGLAPSGSVTMCRCSAVRKDGRSRRTYIQLVPWAVGNSSMSIEICTCSKYPLLSGIVTYQKG